MNTDTTRQLAQRITQGKLRPSVLKHCGFEIACEHEPAGLRGDDPEKANSELIAEAFLVTLETGKTPRQLADERVELIAALTEMLKRCDMFPNDPNHRKLLDRVTVSQTLK